MPSLKILICDANALPNKYIAGASAAVRPGGPLADDGRRVVVCPVGRVVAGGHRLEQLDVDAGQQEEAEGQHDVAEDTTAAAKQSRDENNLTLFCLD